MSVTADSFLQSYPEFSDVGCSLLPASSIVQGELDFVNLVIDSKRFGKYADRATCLMLAHNLSVRFKINLTQYGMNVVDMPGVIISQSAQTGGISVSSAISAMVTGSDAFKADMARTNYGLMFLSLLAVAVPPMRMA
jgi:TATA-binding protein-associated factor Taf7